METSLKLCVGNSTLKGEAGSATRVRLNELLKHAGSPMKAKTPHLGHFAVSALLLFRLCCQVVGFTEQADGSLNVLKRSRTKHQPNFETIFVAGLHPSIQLVNLDQAPFNLHFADNQDWPRQTCRKGCNCTWQTGVFSLLVVWLQGRRLLCAFT